MFRSEICKLCAKTLNGRRNCIRCDTVRRPEAFAAKVCKLQPQDSFSEIPRALAEKVQKKPFALLPWQTPNFHARIPAGIRQICLAGMGGSALGAKTLCEAFPGDRPVTFLDNIDPDFVHQKIANLDPKNTFFVLASKSGQTMEVLSLAKILLGKFAKCAPKNFLVLTDNPKSELGNFAKKWRIPVLPGNPQIPGRFSALAENSLIPFIVSHSKNGSPLAKKILSGSQKANFKKAYELAAKIKTHYKFGKNICCLFPYCERLSTFSDWAVQLIAESLGKTKNIGITPIKAMGAKDQHSQLQLFLDGPADKFFIFIGQTDWPHDDKIPGARYSLGQLFTAEFIGVKKAFRKKHIPFHEISFKTLTPEALGELLFFFELLTAFLGELFRINYENQPAVELSKSLAKKSLLQVEKK